MDIGEIKQVSWEIWSNNVPLAHIKQISRMINANTLAIIRNLSVMTYGTYICRKLI
jgi:hypothetical protein